MTVRPLRGAALALLIGSSMVQAQDATAGKAIFAQCAACHSIDGSSGTGPSLQGVNGRKAGSVPGFRYSRAMKAVGYNWDPATLDAYLADPQGAIPGNVMPYSGLPNKSERADLLAFLSTLR